MARSFNIDWYGEDNAIDYFLFFLAVFGNSVLFGGPKTFDEDPTIVNDITLGEEEE